MKSDYTVFFMLLATVMLDLFHVKREQTNRLYKPLETDKFY